MTTHLPYCHSPLDVLVAAIDRGLYSTMLSGSNRYGRPGAIIEDLSPENRAMLMALTSEDVAKQRWEFGHAKISPYQLAPDLRPEK